MKMATMSDAAKVAKLDQAVDRTDDCSTAHSDQASDTIEARIALAARAIEMVNECASHPLFRACELNSEIDRLMSHQRAQSWHHHVHPCPAALGAVVGKLSGRAIRGNCEDRSLRRIFAIDGIYHAANANHPGTKMSAATFRRVESLADLHGRNLGWLETMANRGSELAPAAALFYCAQNQLSPPPWVLEMASAGYCKALNGKLPKKRGRSAGPVERYRQDIIDYARWEEVQTVREKQTELPKELEYLRSKAGASAYLLKDREKMVTWVGRDWERAYECATMLLRGTPAFGGPDAMKASYQRVRQNSKNNDLRYHLLDAQFLRSIGIEHPAFWHRDRKHVPLYDLVL
jgi:hypothetical protein